MKLFIVTTFILTTLSSPPAFNPDMSNVHLDAYLKSGSFRGYFSPPEFWTFLQQVKAVPEYNKYITEPVSLGKTLGNNDVSGFYICSDASRIAELKTTKNIILLTGLHHSREPLTVTMIILMVTNLLKTFTRTKHNFVKELLRDNVIFFIPMVNIDSYIYMNKMNALGKADENVMMIRKNRNVTKRCGATHGGVDLNRNYDFKFGLDESGSSSDPCAEDYRGPHPFSEKETQAIKRYVDGNSSIVSCVNIHSYGNDWIYPFNYVHDGSDHYLKRVKPLFFNFYREFEHECKQKNRKSHFGNSASLLDYPTNGEAGDWFTGAKNILNLDVELGNNNKKSDTFYPPRNLIPKIVEFNYIIMTDFLRKHIVDFDLTGLVMQYGRQPKIIFEIFNKSISSLKNTELRIKPIFDGKEVNTRLVFAFKTLLHDKAKMVTASGGVISGTFGGRHTLEVDVRLDKEADMKHLLGLELVVKRSGGDYFGYPDQKFVFKRKQHHAGKH